MVWDIATGTVLKAAATESPVRRTALSPSVCPSETHPCLNAPQIAMLRAIPELDVPGEDTQSFIGVGGHTISFWTVVKGETLTDLMVEEFELDGAVASAAELSPTPQLSISLIEGLPGRAMVTYPVRTAAGDAGTAVALWDVAGKRPLARWELGVPQSSTTPNVSSPCPGAFPPDP